MNYQIKLYVHGVPNGQDTWNVTDSDKAYINTFYAQNMSETIRMLVEVRRIGTATNCYYTYLRKGNVSDCNGRAGSYFGLTLCVNYYYVDLQNIYNLLDVAFHKHIVGQNIVRNNGNTIQYSISNFAQVGDKLKALENDLTHYLMRFSSSSDFIPLNGFNVQGQNCLGPLNPLDCDTTIANSMKQCGSIAVSACVPTKYEQQKIQDAKNEVNEANSRVQNAIDAANAQAQKNIQEVCDKYKNVDNTISQLRKANEAANSNITVLKGQINSLTQKLQDTENYKGRCEKAEKDLLEKKKLLEDVCKCLSDLSKLQKQIEALTKTKHPRRPEDGRPSWKDSLRKIIRSRKFLIGCVVIVVLLGGILVFKSCVKKYVTTPWHKTEFQKNSNISRTRGQSCIYFVK